MKVRLTIQEKLKDLRVERGLTLEELEAEVNISKSTLGSYENDEYKDISHTSLITLAKYYGVSTDYLLGFSENRIHQNTALADLHIDDNAVSDGDNRRSSARQTRCPQGKPRLQERELEGSRDRVPQGYRQGLPFSGRQLQSGSRPLSSEQPSGSAEGPG